MVHMPQCVEAFRHPDKRLPGTASITLTAFAASLQSVSHSYLRQKSRIIPVPHISQAQTWDCGLACLLMVLRSVGNLSQDLASLHRLCPTKSVWTVDLAHLLRRFGLEVCFTTLTLGTNPGFAEHPFYGQMHEDEMRVERLFQSAAAVGIEMQQRSVAAAELQQYLLDGQHLVIALVDKLILERGLALWSDAAGGELGDGYKGHYVVLCGYNCEADHYILRDPDPRAAAMGLCSVKGVVLDTARKAFGTDEDLLIIRLPWLQGIST